MLCTTSYKTIAEANLPRPLTLGIFQEFVEDLAGLETMTIQPPATCVSTLLRDRQGNWLMPVEIVQDGNTSAPTALNSLHEVPVIRGLSIREENHLVASSGKKMNSYINSQLTCNATRAPGAPMSALQKKRVMHANLLLTSFI